jgi:hypothetical protein
MAAICKFGFLTNPEITEVEAQLALAIISAEGAFGSARVRINASYYLSKERPEVVIDVSSDVGGHIAQVFTGLLIRQFGEDNFTVERVEKQSGVVAGG